jgi:hypothetical protein
MRTLEAISKKSNGFLLPRRWVGLLLIDQEKLELVLLLVNGTASQEFIAPGRACGRLSCFSETAASYPS